MRPFGFALLVAWTLLWDSNQGRSQAPREGDVISAFQEGIALRKAGKNAEAIPFFAKAAALAQEVFGPDHLNTAGILRNLGSAYFETGQVGEAATAYRRCLEIREQRLGKDHIIVADALSDLAVAYQAMGKLKEAEPLQRRALTISEATLPKDHPSLVTTLNNLATLYQAMGLYPQAEPLYQRCLAIQEATKGKDHPDVGNTLNNFADLYRLMGRLQEGEALARRSLKIWEVAFGKDHLNVAIPLNTLANCYSQMARYREAESLFRRSLTIRETKLGKNHLQVAISLNNLGLLLVDQGQFSEAETVYRRCLEIQEAAQGKDYPQVATVLTNLGGLYVDLGRGREGELLLRRSLEIREAKLGKDHPDVAYTLNYLGVLYQTLGRYQEAEALLRRCLQIGELRYGKDDVQVATYLNNLGSICARMNRSKEAESCYVRALQIHELRAGKDHPSMVYALNNLGALYWQLGQLEKAEVLLQRSLDILETKGVENPANIAGVLGNMAALHQALNRQEQAWKLEERFLEIKQGGLRSIFAFSSEAAMHSYLKTMDTVLPEMITMAAGADAPGAAVTAALTWTLRLKGVVLDTLCRYRQAQHVLTPDDPLTQRVSNYQSLKQLLANAALNPPAGLSPDQVTKLIAQWRKEAEGLESELNRAFAGKEAGQAGANVSTAAVQKRLGPNTALIEFVRVPVRDFKKLIWLGDRYFAFVLNSGVGPAQLIDLGEAKAIDAGVEALRKEFTDFQEKLKECESAEEVPALEKAQEKQFATISAALYLRLFTPLRKALGSAHLLYLAPAGALNRLPFEALVDETGKYLVESYRCAYLSSGRDVLRASVPPAKGTVVFAGPDYKLDAAQRQAQAEKLLAKKDVVAVRGLPGTDLRSVGWKALPGAMAEAKDIQKTLRDSSYGPVKTYVGAEALEEVLKAMPAPRVLHLATHGFFLDHEPEAPAPAEDGAGAGWTRGRLRKMDNPLLRSGIVLAGANTIGDKEATARAEDGWVTAEEIALLNLHGTELVVLSACQTGLGDIKSGEGVFGLRRAFLYAGARTLVTSLFEVPDKDTRDLMMNFYGGLKSGQGKLAALHAAQREMLQRRRQTAGAAHPFFWASFVMVGDPD